MAKIADRGNIIPSDMIQEICRSKWIEFIPKSMGIRS